MEIQSHCVSRIFLSTQMELIIQQSKSIQKNQTCGCVKLRFLLSFKMMNKNCANYTDFSQNHYQKRIVQAPGGESHFSLAWSDEKTDYGPPRNSRSLGKKGNQPAQEGTYGKQQTYGQPTYPQQAPYQQQPPYQQPPPQNYGNQYQQEGTYNTQGYQQGSYEQRQYEPVLQNQPEPVYQLKQQGQQSQHQQYNYKQEGTYGPPSASTNTRSSGSTTNLYQPPPDQIDLMAKQYEVKNLGNDYDDRRKKEPTQPSQHTPQQSQQQQYRQPPRPPSNPMSNQKPEDKACIKIRGAPQSQIVFGDNSYNYWKDGNKETPGRKGYHQQDPPTQGSYEPQSRSLERRQQPPAEEFKPSVRVHNPPGGKSNFQLG